MNYTSTRDNKVSLSASKAILQGLSHDGGLFVPEVMPKLGVSLDALVDMSYQEVAYEVMKSYFTDICPTFHWHLPVQNTGRYMYMRNRFRSDMPDC